MATMLFNNLITFSRGTNATLTGPTGLIQWAPSNLLTYSEQFDNAPWANTVQGTGVAATVTANAGTAPDGTATADRLQFSLAGGTTTNDITRRRQDFTAPATTYVFSVYLKTFDGSTQTVHLVGPTGATTSVVVTGDWQRFSVSGVSTGGVVSYAIGLRGGWTPINSNTADVLAWGAQLELGSTATTYNSTTVKNLLGYSEAFDNAAWTKSNASIVTGAAANPVNGLFNAQKLMVDAATTTHRASQIATTANGVSHTMSLYVKAAEYSRVGLREGNFSGAYASFNLATGVLIDQGSGGVGSIADLGNGWFRVSMTSASGGATMRLDIFPLPASYTTGSPSIAYTGDGNSGIYIWGAQLSDSGSLDPYVPTPGAAPTSAAYYGPRFDYDPVTLAPKGLLVEEARTNLLTYSEDITNAAWIKTLCTVVANGTISPDGAADADKVTDNSGSGTEVSQTVTVTSGATVANSRYFKYIDCRWVRLTIGDATNFVRGWFDIQNGVVGGTSTGGTGTGAVVSITPSGNGWYRCTLIGALTGATSYPCLSMTALDNNTAARVSGGSYFIWGAQAEAGAFATSYIPTVASTVTRSADVATLTGTNFAPWYNQNAGTLVVSASQPTIFGLSKTAASVNDVGSSRFNIYRQALGGINGFVTPGSGAIASGVSATANTPWKAVLAYTTTDGYVSANGASVVSGAHTIPLGTLNNLCIGNAASIGSEHFNGHIRSVTYYPDRASNTQLQSITT